MDSPNMALRTRACLLKTVVTPERPDSIARREQDILSCSSPWDREVRSCLYRALVAISDINQYPHVLLLHGLA